jgi:hypothetical protein
MSSILAGSLISQSKLTSVKNRTGESRPPAFFINGLFCQRRATGLRVCQQDRVRIGCVRAEAPPAMSPSGKDGTMPAVSEQRRKHRRYPLRLPVRISPKAAGGPQIETSTNDISAEGIYFSLPEEPTLGSKLTLQLTLPPELTQGESVSLHSVCKVARVERRDADGKIGVGTTIESYRFVRSE